MRFTRMRALAAGVLGAATITLAAPASATPPTPSTSPTASATPTGDPSTEILGTSSPEPTESADPQATASLDPSASPSVDPSASPSLDPSASPGVVDPSASPTATSSPSPGAGTGDPVLDGFLSMLPFKVPLDKEIDGIEDFDVNPLVLTYTCGDGGPSWKLQNLSDKAFGFGWFDTSLGAGISDIGPNETLDLQTHAMAVIASPWDAETGYLLVTVPTVGVSDCAGTPPPAAAPVSVPVATAAAATAVQAEPYYTG